jgi:hypothetical protein
LISAGLFVARVVLEAARRPWPGVVVVAGGLVAALGGLALGRVLAARHVRLWPALLLLVYVGWPRRDPVAAASVAVLAALVWLLGRKRRSPRRWAEPLADGVTFVTTLVVYVATAAPDVLPADAGEFQLAAALLGVAHPPGFPLYTMVGHLFIRLLPWGTPAYRLNVMSGIIAAGTLVLVARATRLWARQLGASSLVTLAGGLAAALTLGTATTFWAQATIASKRPFTVFFVALALYALSRFAATKEARGADRALVLLGLALGLGFGQDALGFASILFVAIYALLVDPRLAVQPRRWWRPALAGLAGLLPLAYLPIQGAMGAVLAPEGLDTLPGFLHHFLGLGFSGDMFAFANAADLPHRLALLPTLFSLQFNVVILAAALLGLLGLLRRDWRLFALLAGTLVLQTFISITYRAPQTVEYLMPAYLPVTIAVGLLPAVFHTPRPASGALQPALSLSKGPFLAAVVLWAGLLNGWAHGPSFVELAGDHTARQAVGPLLETAPAGALILADWRWAMPLRYLREVEGLRPDVEVRYVYPVAGVEYRDVWLRRIGEADPGVPILLTHFYQFDGYTTEPWETGFLVRPQPVTEPAAPLVPVGVTFGDRVHVLGYGLRQDRFHPGQVAEFVLAWRPAGPLERAPSFTLRLVDAENRHRAQVDRRLGAERAPEDVHFQRLALPLYPTLPPGRYRVMLGAYTVTEAGFENLPTPEGETAITLAELDLVPLGCSLQPSIAAGPSAARQTAAGRVGAVCDRPSTPFTLHRQAVPFLGGPTLVGVDYDRSVPDVLRVYLDWRGPAGEGWQVRVQTAAGGEAIAPLASIPAGAYQTVGLDLPGAMRSGLWLSLADGQGSALSSSKGQVRRAAGPWGWSVEKIRLPTAAPDARFVPLGDEMAVVGATAHPAAPGKKMAVDVTLVALRPLTSDDGTSVRLVDGEGRWLATDDCQPALGAVPTLKWIGGSRVVDRHLLPLREDFTGGEVGAAFVVYERFRMTPLPPMDGRFSEVPLGTWPLR